MLLRDVASGVGIVDDGEDKDEVTVKPGVSETDELREADEFLSGSKWYIDSNFEVVVSIAERDELQKNDEKILRVFHSVTDFVVDTRDAEQ